MISLVVGLELASAFAIQTMTLLPGQIIDDRYCIVRELGAGAMGAVYEGVNTAIKRRVAIKVLLPGVAEQADVVKRFEREAQAAGRIGSEHIVEVLDLGTLPDGGLYMVMEFLEGVTLSERIRQCGRLSPEELLPIAQQLLDGLQLAHEAGIIHRDLKPDNIFLQAEHTGQRDFVKILDFGISKFNPLSGEGMSMTRTGTVMGTPHYMAPEQAKGASNSDARSDLYSVGVICYEAVTGQVPFDAQTFNELIFKIVLDTPPAPETFVPNLNAGFSQIIQRAMTREPEHRFANAKDMAKALTDWFHAHYPNGTAINGRISSAPISAPFPPSSRGAGLAARPAAATEYAAQVDLSQAPDNFAPPPPSGAQYANPAGTITGGPQQAKRRAQILAAAIVGSVLLVVAAAIISTLSTSSPSLDGTPTTAAKTNPGEEASQAENPTPPASPSASPVKAPPEGAPPDRTATPSPAKTAKLSKSKSKSSSPKRANLQRRPRRAVAPAAPPPPPAPKPPPPVTAPAPAPKQPGRRIQTEL